VHCELVDNAMFAGEEAAQAALRSELEVLTFESCSIYPVSGQDDENKAVEMDDDGLIHELVDVAQLSCFPHLRELSLNLSLVQENTGRITGLNSVLSACPCLCVLGLEFEAISDVGGFSHLQPASPAWLAHRLSFPALYSYSGCYH